MCAIDNIYTHTHTRKRLFHDVDTKYPVEIDVKNGGGNEKGTGNTHDTYNNRTAAADGLNCWAATAERTANETLDSTTEDKNSTSAPWQ